MLSDSEKIDISAFPAELEITALFLDWLYKATSETGEPVALSRIVISWAKIRPSAKYSNINKNVMDLKQDFCMVPMTKGLKSTSKIIPIHYDNQTIVTKLLYNRTVLLIQEPFASNNPFSEFLTLISWIQ